MNEICTRKIENRYDFFKYLLTRFKITVLDLVLMEKNSLTRFGFDTNTRNVEDYFKRSHCD